MTKGSAVLLLEGSYSRYVAFRDKSGLVFDIQLCELIYDKHMEKLKLGTPKRPIIISMSGETDIIPEAYTDREAKYSRDPKQGDASIKLD
jgi:hypothetical protein